MLLPIIVILCPNIFRIFLAQKSKSSWLKQKYDLYQSRPKVEDGVRETRAGNNNYLHVNNKESMIDK